MISLFLLSRTTEDSGMELSFGFSETENERTSFPPCCKGVAEHRPSSGNTAKHRPFRLQFLCCSGMGASAGPFRGAGFQRIPGTAVYVALYRLTNTANLDTLSRKLHIG